MIDRDRIELIRQQAYDALWAGDYERSLLLYEDGLRLVQSSGNQDLEDLFTCDRSVVLMEMNRYDIDVSRLKQILLRNPSGYNGALAAHACARAHEMRGEISRARFYANTALQRSRDSGFEDLLSGAYNVLGNLELRESRFEAARDLYREAIRCIEKRGEPITGLATYADNLGYCHIALGQAEAGARLVRQAVDLFGQLGVRQALDFPCLDLGLAHVRMGRFDEAEYWGLRALGLGEEFSRAEVVKNSHFLLAETYSKMGHEGRADEHFGVLASYYPEIPALKDLLRQVSLLDLVNFV